MMKAASPLFGIIVAGLAALGAGGLRAAEVFADNFNNGNVANSDSVTGF